MAFYHNNYYILSMIYFHSRKYHLLFIKIIAMSATITIFWVRNIFTKTSITADYCYVKVIIEHKIYPQTPSPITISYCNAEIITIF